MGVKFKALQMVFEVYIYIYIGFLCLTLQFHLLHFHKSYFTHLKTNSSDFCDIRCIKKRVTINFKCSKAIDQCEKNYKTLFPNVFHILVYLPY
jgi:hypothetical protein